MKVYVTIVVNCDDTRAIYVGTSEKQAEKKRKEYENVERGIYCYVSFYNSKANDVGFRNLNKEVLYGKN